MARGIILLSALLLFGVSSESNSHTTADFNFEISFSAGAHPAPITGRVYVILSKDGGREPRLQRSPQNALIWGEDIYALKPGVGIVIDEHIFGFPITSIREVPPGDYYAQGFVNVYTEFKRSDGHTLWLHNDQWEGQRWNRSPGNLYSDAVKVSIDPAQTGTITISCTNVIPPVEIPSDTKLVKRVKFKSDILTEFWGEPIYLGATVLLPKDYERYINIHYPVNYIQGHFSLGAPYGFSDSGRRPSQFSQFWMSDSCPRMLAVTFQHPCPYYDDSYAVNSPNVGPYQDAIMQELIPYIEDNFRVLHSPFARVLSGGSTGGWIALMLQIYQPDFFGGVFSLCPDPVDFRAFQCVDIYRDENAYYKDFGWLKVPTPSDRTTSGIVTYTYQQRNHYELVLGTKNRSGEQIDIFEAAFGPVGADGYVQPLFDKASGEIDHEVVEYWREHYDLRHHLEVNWAWLGPKLVGKLHIYTGDMDTFYLNNAVKLLEEFLESTEDPYYAGIVEYGDGQPHCWGPRGESLIRVMDLHIMLNAPPGVNTAVWHYK